VLGVRGREEGRLSDYVLAKDVLDVVFPADSPLSPEVRVYICAKGGLLCLGLLGPLLTWENVGGVMASLGRLV
jgi:hypothetical protein